MVSVPFKTEKKEILKLKLRNLGNCTAINVYLSFMAVTAAGSFSFCLSSDQLLELYNVKMHSEI